jgi:hypothetical protein
MIIINVLPLRACCVRVLIARTPRLTPRQLTAGPREGRFVLVMHVWTSLLSHSLVSYDILACMHFVPNARSKPTK